MRFSKLRALPLIGCLPLLLGVFRGAELGQHCGGILDAERKLESRFSGSLPREDGSYLLTFRGTYDDREASIGYNCRSDRLYGQTIMLKLSSEATAQELLKTYRARLTNRLGAATVDSTKEADFETLPKEARDLVNALSDETIIWVSGDEVVSLALDHWSSKEWNVSLGSLWLH
jgi:hypothetical protein